MSTNDTIATIDYVSAKISSVLTPAVADGWEMYRTQMQIEGLASVLYGIGILFVMWFAYGKMKAIYASGKLGDDPFYDIGFMVGVVVMLIGIMSAPELIINGIMHLLNPDYYVLQGILDVFK